MRKHMLMMTKAVLFDSAKAPLCLGLRICSGADGNDEIGGWRPADILNSVLVVRMHESPRSRPQPVGLPLPASSTVPSRISHISECKWRCGGCGASPGGNVVSCTSNDSPLARPPFTTSPHCVL